MQAHPLSPKPNSFLLTAGHCLSEFSSRKTEDIDVAAISNQALPPKCNTSSNLLRIQWNFSYGMASVLPKLPAHVEGQRKETRSHSCLHPQVPATAPVVSDKLNSVCWMNGWVLWALNNLQSPTSFILFDFPKSPGT